MATGGGWEASGPGRGLLLTLALTLPWLVTIFFISHGAFYQQSLGHDFGAKLMGGEESHGDPPGLLRADRGGDVSGPRRCSCCPLWR